LQKPHTAEQDVQISQRRPKQMGPIFRTLLSHRSARRRISRANTRESTNHLESGSNIATRPFKDLKYATDQKTDDGGEGGWENAQKLERQKRWNDNKH